METVTTTAPDVLLLQDRLDPTGAFERIVRRRNPDAVVHDWQRPYLRDRARRICVLAARQVGKTEVARAKCLVQACTRPNQVVIWISFTEALSFEALGQMRLDLDVFPYISAVNASRGTIELSNGSVIIGLSASPDVARGRTVDLAVCDEDARLSDDVLVSVLPSLAVRDGQLILASTPAGSAGHFYDIVGGPETDEWSRYVVPATLSPNYSPEQLAALERGLGTNRYKVEYLCEFAAGSGIPVWDSVELALMFGANAEESERMQAVLDDIPVMVLPDLADVVAGIRFNRRGD